MPDTELLAGRIKDVRDVTTSVVRQEALCTDPLAPVPAKSSPEEGGGCHGSLVGQDLDIGEPAVVVDADVNELPTASAVSSLTVSRDAMSNPPESPEFLGVEMEQLARPIPFIANHLWLRIKARQPFQLQALEHRGHGGAGHGQAHRDPGGGQTLLAA